MALSSVRALFKGKWYTLQYNPATNAYEVEIEPVGTSANEPGGVYNTTLELKNDIGVVRTFDGSTIRGLNLKVKEQVPPVLTLISPKGPYITVKRPTIVIHAQDEEGGSRINASTLTLSFDGSSVSFSKTTIDRGYEIRYTPSYDLSEGYHTARATVKDVDGNFTALDMRWMVDTEPPILKIHSKKMRRIVDTPTSIVILETWDVMSGLASVTADGHRANLVDAENNLYECEVPLEIGRNDVEVVSTDKAGLRNVQHVRVMRMITDRVKSDVYFEKNPPRKPIAKWTSADHAKWKRDLLYGCYDDIAMNRVCDAVRLMLDVLDTYGFWAIVDPKPNWSISDAPTTNDYYLRRYISDVDAIQCSMPVILNPRIELPRSLEETDHVGANNIEKALVNIDANLKALIFDLYSAKEISAAET